MAILPVVACQRAPAPGQPRPSPTDRSPVVGAAEVDSRLPTREPWGFSLQARELNARFDASGAAIASWRFGWVGAPTEPEVEGTRVVYRRPGQVVEWYEARPEGIEQGFDVARRPSGDLVIAGHVHTRGGGHVRGDEAVFEEVRVHGLRAWDAAERPLRATMEWRPAEGILAYRIAAAELAGAEFPVVIDPLLTSPEWTAQSDQGNANLGTSVASAGDVNGDGYADVIVGVPDYQNGESGEGRALVYLGSPAGPSLVADWAFESDQVDAHLGVSVAAAGDIDGDGYGDVIVGADLFDGGQTDEGRAYVFHGSPSGLSLVPDWTFEPDQADAHLGVSVASAGDVNGDGHADVIVGADLFDGGATDEGSAFVFHGSPAGLSLIPDWNAESDQGDAHMGASVASAGDVDGDGYGDVIVGAPDDDSGELNEGTARVYLGSSTGLELAAVWLAQSDQADAHLGASVASAGDVDGDGFGDVIVGAPDYDNGEGNEGTAFLYLGSALGPSLVDDWTSESDQPDAHLGASVASAGDVNGDGFSDLLVGAPDYDDGQTDEGRAYLYLGSATGAALTAAWTFESDQGSAFLGGSVAWAGDVNGDGLGDAILGAHGYDDGQVDEGRASLFLGWVSGPPSAPTWTVESDQAFAILGNAVDSAGDVDGDGYGDVIVGLPGYDNVEPNEGRAEVYLGSAGGMSTTPSWTAESDQADAEMGVSVATAGDVNGDGYGDVIVGAYLYDNGEADEGRAYLYLGSPAGPSLTPDWTAEPDVPDARFGVSVASAGDVNGDGYGDVIVGASSYSNGEVSEGGAFVYLGSASGPSLVADWSYESDQSDAHLGASVASAGDINGDGFSDVAVGAPDWEDGDPGEGGVFVFLGSPSGLRPAPTWILDQSLAGARLGVSVGSAGDVNGDGFGDVIVGADGYENGHPVEGGAFLYEGSASGLNTTPTWIGEPNQIAAGFGIPAGSAGDVDGDGYGDVIVGANTFDAGETNEGRAFVYRGSPGGLLPAPSYTLESNQIGARFGYAARSARDITGDGFGDLIVGAFSWDVTVPFLVDAGRAYTYPGGDGAAGLGRQLAQYRADGITSIHAGGEAGGDTVVLEGRVTQEGGLGGMLRMEFEVKRMGAPFDGTGTVLSPAVPAGSTADVTVSGLLGPQRWRARVVYPVGSGWGRWVSFGGNSEADPDFLTPRVANAADCEGPSECSSGFCVNATCCSDECSGNCDRCDLPGSEGTCIDDDPTCTGNCDQCVAGNCVPVPAACTGTCAECVGGGTDFSCVAAPLLCAGDCVACQAVTPTQFDCLPEVASCTGNCAECQCAGQTCNCGPNASLCTGNCDACIDTGGDFSCAASPSACTGTCGGASACTGSGTEFNCTGNHAACTGNCVDCSCVGSICNCSADPTLCSGDCAECAGGGTSFSCAPSDALCPALCDRCEGAGTDFSCALMPMDGIPDADCGGVGPCQGECDGAGACDYPPATQTCQAASCTGSTLDPADTCDGAGTCVESTDIPCDPYTCNPFGNACRTVCTVAADCVAPFECVGGQCKAPNGQPCSANGECASGHCVDDVCCNSECTGLCRACDLPSSLGACTNLPLDGVADSECPGSGTCQGECDGEGACHLPGSDVSCGTCSTCDGAGECAVVPATDPACGEIECSGLDDTCRTFAPLQDACASLGECAEDNDPAKCTAWTARNEGESCGSGVCADARTCQEGVCTVAPLVCADDDECTEDTCDPGSGECVFTKIDGCGSDGGCGCAVGRAPEPDSGAVIALSLLLSLLCRRPRRRS